MSDNSKVVTLIPAHNEQDQIEETIASLYNQTRPPDQVLVIADNCTDNTVAIVQCLMRVYPTLEIFETVGNKAKKAGALNQGVARLQPRQWDYLLQMDADTVLDCQLLEQALKEFEREPQLAGVGSRCFLKTFDDTVNWWGRTLWRFQNLEYGIADSRHIQRNGKAKVLAGAVCLYRMDVLQQVVRQNWNEFDRLVIWREDSLVEDYELTLDTQKIGYKAEIGLKMFSYTDAMFSLRDLWKQRFRWYGGTAATLRRRGFAREVLSETIIQSFYVLIIMSRLLMLAMVATMAGWGLVGTAPIQFSFTVWLLPMVGLILVNYVYRFRYTRNRDFPQWLLVVSLVPIELYITYDQFLTLLAYTKNLLNPSKSW